MYVLSTYSFDIHKFNVIIFKSYIDLRNKLKDNYHLLFSKPSCLKFTFNDTFDSKLISCNLSNNELHLEFDFSQSSLNFINVVIETIKLTINNNVITNSDNVPKNRNRTEFDNTEFLDLFCGWLC